MVIDVPPRPKRVGRPRRGSEGEATRRILDAAIPIFLAEGYEAASVDAIAVAAGASKKTFYAKFASKADLFEAVCLRLIETTLPPIEREAATGAQEHRPERWPPAFGKRRCNDRSLEHRAGSDIQHDALVAEGLYRISSAVLEVGLTPEGIALRRIIAAESVRFPEFARTLHDFGHSRLAPMIERCLEEGVRRGELAIEDVRFAADYFINAAILPPINRAMFGLERAELTHVKREALRRTLTLFLASFRVAADERPHR